MRPALFFGWILVAIGMAAFNCTQSTRTQPIALSIPAAKPLAQQMITGAAAGIDSGYTTIHVKVALCDNKYQGIVPVPAGIGNGQDPVSNLYWGCGYGIATYFSRSSQWHLLATRKMNGPVLERRIFKHRKAPFYLVADAWDGKEIKACTVSFLHALSGEIKDTVHVNHSTIGTDGNAQLVAYIGHDGLMDFKLNQRFPNTDGQHRDALMLACYSKHFFGPHLQATLANPVLWSTGLMSPEAYTLHDALNAYVQAARSQVQPNAAAAYAKYQHCSIKAASRLLVTGW